MKSFKEWVKNKESINENDTTYPPEVWNSVVADLLNSIKSAEEKGDIAYLMEIQSDMLVYMKRTQDPYVLEKLNTINDAVKKAIYSFKSKGHGYPGGGG